MSGAGPICSRGRSAQQHGLAGVAGVGAMEGWGGGGYHWGGGDTIGVGGGGGGGPGPESIYGFWAILMLRVFYPTT